MRKVELQILAKDILETNYFDAKDCAITRALHRVGLTDYQDSGPLITLINGGMFVPPININEDEHLVLRRRVQNMYGKTETPEEPVDFVHTLTFYDLEE